MTTLIFLALVAQSTPAEDASAKARAALKPFKVSLKEALTDALKDSPVKAIEVCSTKAPELAKASATSEVTVGRAAPRLRNPANAPPAWLAAPMRELERADAGTDAFRVIPLGPGRYGYAEALWTQPMCLTCHGETIAEPVARALKARYPADRAVGFKDGSFRGVWWAEVQLDGGAMGR